MTLDPSEGGTTVIVSWSSLDGEAQDFVVSYTPTDGPAANRDPLLITETSKTISGLVPGTTYTFVVVTRSQYNDGYTVDSDSASITTSMCNPFFVLLSRSYYLIYLVSSRILGMGLYM